MLNPAAGGTSNEIKDLRNPEETLKQVQGDNLRLFTRLLEVQQPLERVSFLSLD
jgi:hypothetical protein